MKHSPQNETPKLLDKQPPSSNVAPVNTTIAISIVAMIMPSTSKITSKDTTKTTPK